MRTELEKGEVEIAVFGEFARQRDLLVEDSTVKKLQPPNPDLSCEILGEGTVAFELVEICDASMARLSSRGVEANGVYLRTSDPTRAVVEKKLRKQYQTALPVELLCYSGQVVSPDSTIIAEIQALLTQWPSPFQFRRVWLLGRKGVYQVWPW